MAKEPNKTPEKDKDKRYVDWDTTGKVSKWMRKWGYDPAKGLGRNSDGIMRPIEATVLPKYMGLGYLDLATISPVLPPVLPPVVLPPVLPPVVLPPVLPPILPPVQSLRGEHKTGMKKISPGKIMINSLATETEESLFQHHKKVTEYLKRCQERIKEGKTERLKEGKTVPSSSYEEDIYPRNHSTVWGSFCIKHPEKHQRGYQCCKQVDKDSSCLCPPKNKTKSRRGRRGKNKLPAEVKDLGKKPEERAMESLASVPNADLTEKGSDQLSLSAPAISNGGRDAASLKTTDFGSSALKLVKQKLHDSAVPFSSTTTSVEANGCKAIEVTPSGESGNGTGKVKDAPGAGDLSDSSSDS